VSLDSSDEDLANKQSGAPAFAACDNDDGGVADCPPSTANPPAAERKQEECAFG
jgi:hypothetical protein